MTDTSVPDDRDDEVIAVEVIEEITEDGELVEIDVVEVVSTATDDPASAVAPRGDGPNSYTEGDDTDPEVIPGTTNEDIARD
jgi:hypothetical protein